MVEPSPQSYLYLQDFQGSKLLNSCFLVYSSDFSAFVIDMLYTGSQCQSSFYEICSLAVCINIKTCKVMNHDISSPTGNPTCFHRAKSVKKKKLRKDQLTQSIELFYKSV